MDNKQKGKIESEIPLKKQTGEELHFSFDEIWEKALEEVENRKIEESLLLVKELKEENELEKEFIKKHGKEPESKTPDGKINPKYIEYVLWRDFGLKPDVDNIDPYKNFSWGGLTGEEAFVAFYNCE